MKRTKISPLANCLLILLVLAGVSTAQEQKKQSFSEKIVAWSAGDKCSADSFDLAESDHLVCDSFVIDGAAIKTITFNKVFVAVSFTDDGDNVIADLYVRNATGKRIFVDPSLGGLSLYRSREDFLSNKPLVVSVAIPPSKIAGKLLGKVRWANAFATIGAGFQTQTATVTSGTQTATVTVPNTSAQARAENENADRAMTANSAAASIMTTALKANTIFDGDKVNGLVYFKRSKKAKFGVAMFSVADTTFAFELDELP